MLMSIERFCAIYFPIRTKSNTSNKKVAGTLVVTGILLAVINLHFFWTYKLKSGRSGMYCGSVSKYSIFLKEYWPWINLATYSLIPFTVLICSSTAVIMKIVHSNYVRRHEMNQKEGGVKLTTITLTLLCVSFMFVLTTGPVVIYRYLRFSRTFNSRIQKPPRMWVQHAIVALRSLTTGMSC